MIIRASFSREGRDSFVSQWKSDSKAGALLLQRASWQTDGSAVGLETVGHLLSLVGSSKVDWNALHNVVAAGNQLYSVALVRFDSNEARVEMIGARAVIESESRTVTAHIHDQLSVLTGALGDEIARPESTLTTAREIYLEFGNPENARIVVMDFES